MEAEGMEGPSGVGGPAESIEAVRCRVTTHFTGESGAAVAAAAERLPVVPFPTSGTSFAEVVAAVGLTRTTEIDRKSVPKWTVVRDDRDGSSLFWDHEQRSWIGFGAEELGKDDFGPYEGLKLVTDTDKESKFASVTVHDHGLGTIRLDLEFHGDLVPRHLSGLVLEAIVGSQLCHANTGFPLKELAELGCVVSYQTFVGDSPLPAVVVTVDEIESGIFPVAWFEAPDGFSPLKLIERVDDRFGGADDAGTDAAERAPRSAGDVARVGRVSQALMAEIPLTPDCIGSTRYGAMAGVLRQDLFDHITSLLNTAVPLLGTAGLMGGTLTIPWLANLSAIASASSTAPGSGLFSVLRDPRVPSTPGVKATGGTGLLDRLAWKILASVDDNNMARLQREFAAGTMATTLTSWGVPAAATSKLTMAGGDLAALTENEQIDVVERFQATDLATISLTGLPSTLPATGFFTWAGLIRMRVTAITGMANFSTIPVGGFVTAAIGSSANVGVGVMLPDCTFTATVMRALTPGGWGVIAGIAVSCLFNPFSCGVAIPLATVLAFLLNNVTALTVTSTAASAGFDIQFAWDPAAQRVEPKVTVASTGGTINVVSTWVTPNIIANLFESAILGLANLFNIWPTLIAEIVAALLQAELSKHGVGFPVGLKELEAEDGGAWSAAGQSLTLHAGIKPFAGLTVQPYVTQVPTMPVITHALEDSIAVMWHDVNPQPATPAPGPGKVTAVGLYGGLSLSQNALNYYLFARWRAGGFEMAITDPALITKLGLLMPALKNLPSAIHLWPAVPPRVEVSMDGLTTDGRPLVMFFDDVRACFEVPTPPFDNMPGVRGIAELSFNFKTTASLTIEWPFVVRILTDAGPFATTPSDIRVEEFFDLNDSNVMSKFGVAAWQPVAEVLAILLAGVNNAASLSKPTTAPAWKRPTPGITQSLSGEELYMEILGLRRVIQLLPAFNQAFLLELVDGSGAPTLNTLLGSPTPSVSLATMTRAHGVVVRGLLGVIKALPAFPPP